MAKVKSKLHSLKNDRSSTLYFPMNRRLFLRHVGGFIAIPLLPSLLPRQAWAQSADPNSFRRAVFMVNKHGGHYDDADPQGVNYSEVTPNIRIGNLLDGQLGPIYDKNYMDLRNKLTVIKGLDLGVTTGHSISSALAASEFYYSANDGANGGKWERYSAFPDSIDTVLSQSNKVYQNPAQQAVPVLRLDPGGSGSSHCFENYHIVSAMSDLAAIRSLVQGNIIQNPDTPSTGPSERELANHRKKLALETALLSLNATQKKGQIGQEDKIRLEQYQTLLESLRQRVPSSGDSTSNPGNTNLNMCQNIPQNGKDTEQKMAQILVAALACGVTKVAYMRMQGEHYYVHRVHQPESRKAHENYLREKALPIGSYTMKLMDQVNEANGNTLLDNSCVLITSDLANSRPHNCVNMRVLVGGSLNGKLRTGLAIDYMNRQHRIQQGLYNDGNPYKPIYGGRLYNELLISIMQGFGLTPSDYERPSLKYRAISDVSPSAHPKFNGKGFGTYECLGENFCSASKQGKGQEISSYIDYLYNVYLKNYQKNTTLPEYYIG